MKRKSVLLLASTGYIIRDLMFGKFADELIRDMDLVVAVPDPNDGMLKDFIAGKPITLIPFHSQSETKTLIHKYFGLQHWMYRFKQIEKNNASLEIAARLWEPNIYGKKKKLVNFMLLVGKLVNKLHLMGTIEELFLSIVSGWKITKQWELVLKELQPSAVVSTTLTLPQNLFTPSIDLPVLLAARRLGIPNGSLVQSWDNLSSKTYVLPVWLDRYWTWSNAMTRELLRFNPRISKERVKDVGSPHFDFHLDVDILESRYNFVANLGLDANRPYVLIGTGIRTWVPNEPITMISLIKLLKAEIPDLQILLRVHPKDTSNRWAEYLAVLNDLEVKIQQKILLKHMDSGGFTPPKEFFYEQVNTIKHAHVILNIASSLTVDAAVLDRPVVSIGYDTITDDKFPEGRAWFYNNSEHFGPLVKTGGVSVVRSEEECMKAIRAYIAEPALHNAGRKEIAEMVTGCADGLAGKRLANEVLHLVSQANG